MFPIRRFGRRPDRRSPRPPAASPVTHERSLTSLRREDCHDGSRCSGRPSGRRVRGDVRRFRRPCHGYRHLTPERQASSGASVERRAPRLIRKTGRRPGCQGPPALLCVLMPARVRVPPPATPRAAGALCTRALCTGALCHSLLRQVDSGTGASTPVSNPSRRPAVPGSQDDVVGVLTRYTFATEQPVPSGSTDRRAAVRPTRPTRAGPTSPRGGTAAGLHRSRPNARPPATQAASDRPRKKRSPGRRVCGRPGLGSRFGLENARGDPGCGLVRRRCRRSAASADRRPAPGSRKSPRGSAPALHAAERPPRGSCSGPGPDSP